MDLESCKRELESLEQPAAPGARAPALPPWALVLVGVLRFVLDRLPADPAPPAQP